MQTSEQISENNPDRPCDSRALLQRVFQSLYISILPLTLERLIYYCLLLFALLSTISVAGQTITASLALLLALTKVCKDRQMPSLKGLDATGILFFFGALTISNIFAINKSISFDFLINYMYRLSIFFIAASFIKTRKQIQSVLIALAISILVTDIYSISQWIQGIGRVNGFFRNPMILAGCLMVLLPVLFVQTIYNREHRYLFVPALVASLFTLILNQTRGAWIAVGITAIIGCFLLRSYRKQIIGCIAIILIGAVLFAGFNPKLAARFDTIFDMNHRSNSERILLWNSASQMLMDYPITGVGLGNFREQYITNYISPLAKQPKLGHAHNNILHIFAETGILGGVAFLYMFYMIFKKCYSYVYSTNSWKSNMAIMCILMTSALMLQGLTEHNFGQSVSIRMFWFVLGIVYASFQMNKEH
jgi:O-antigen ligase